MISQRLRVRVLATFIASLPLLGGCATTHTSAAVRNSPEPMSGNAAMASDTAITDTTALLSGFGRMWTYDAPPLQYWQHMYGFSPDQKWLDHVRLASIRLPECSSSFVSAHGLVLTNHHCGRDCTAAVSPSDSNYVETGFAAATMADEKKCPDFFVDQLQSIEDVTPRVLAARTAPDLAGQARQQDSITHAIEAACNAATTDGKCQVVSLYSGSRFSLYKYRHFDDVRLVMAPEASIAFFGGDPDNFTYPRYDLDLTLLRVYVNGQPYTPPDYLAWSPHGAADSEVVFVSGNPGETRRLYTVAQLEFLRDVELPGDLDAFRRALGALRERAAGSPQAARAYQNLIFEFANTEKAVSGQYRGLEDSSLMNLKRASERAIRARVMADPALRSKYGSAWDSVAAVERELAQTDAERRFSELGEFGDPLGLAVLHTVQVAMQSSLPESARLPEFRGHGLDSAKDAVIASDPRFDPGLARRLLTDRLRSEARALPANDPVRQAAMGTLSPEDAATRLLGTTLTSSAARKALVEGGAAAVAASTDPYVMLARVADPIHRRLQARADTLDASIAANTAQIARAMYQLFGAKLPPDATFTLRITDGVVRGYPMNGTEAPAHTTFYGLYDRAGGFDDQDPFKLPARWETARHSQLDLSTPFDLVTTNDITGGNSGSPMINRDGQIVGLIFDGNIESLPNDFYYTDRAARAVAVDSRAIVAALRDVYNAGRLADELQGVSH